MCKYCEPHEQYGGYDVDCLIMRKPSKYNDGIYTGIQAFIDIDTKELVMYACIDNANIKPVHEDASIPISYCPICGRKLG